MNKRLLITLVVLCCILAVSVLAFGNRLDKKSLTVIEVKIPNETQPSILFDPMASGQNDAESTNYQTFQTSIVEIDPTIYQIAGYYSPYSRVMYPIEYDPARDPKPVTVLCPAITIVSGDNDLILKHITHYKEIGAKYLDVNGNYIFDIDLDKIQLDQKNIFIYSTSSSSVSLSIKERPPGEHGCEMDCCRGFIDVVSVSK